MEMFFINSMRGVDEHCCTTIQDYVGIAQIEDTKINCNLEIKAEYADIKDNHKIAKTMYEIAYRMGANCKSIKEVIFNNPTTIILWNDGTKTVVKVEEGEKYDKERGFLMCYLKGIVGNKTLLKELEKWVGDEE